MFLFNICGNNAQILFALYEDVSSAPSALNILNANQISGNSIINKND